jgi:hypothetical protein
MEGCRTQLRLQINIHPSRSIQHQDFQHFYCFMEKTRQFPSFQLVSKMMFAVSPFSNIISEYKIMDEVQNLSNVPSSELLRTDY